MGVEQETVIGDTPREQYEKRSFYCEECKVIGLSCFLDNINNPDSRRIEYDLDCGKSKGTISKVKECRYFSKHIFPQIA